MLPLLRCFVAAAVIAATQGTIEQVRRQSDAEAANAAEFDVEPLPLKLGNWTGTELEQDAEVFREVGAIKMVERMYSNEQGQKIGVIVATFPTGTDILPHPPDLCYAGQGWNVRDEAWHESTSQRRYKQFRIERQGITAGLVTYWYQLRSEVASNRNELREVLQKIRTARQAWPPMVKVLIHAPVEFSEKDANTASEELGDEIYRWTSEKS